MVPLSRNTGIAPEVRVVPPIETEARLTQYLRQISISKTTRSLKNSYLAAPSGAAAAWMIGSFSSEPVYLPVSIPPKMIDPTELS